MMSDHKEKLQGSKKPNVKPKLDSKGSFNLGTSEQRQRPKTLRRSRSNDVENRWQESYFRDQKEGGRQQRSRSEEDICQVRHPEYHSDYEYQYTECFTMVIGCDNVSRDRSKWRHQGVHTECISYFIPRDNVSRDRSKWRHQGHQGVARGGRGHQGRQGVARGGRGHQLTPGHPIGHPTGQC